MNFDEVDLNVIYDALCDKIRNTEWDIDSKDGWEELKRIKQLCSKIAAALDGEETK